MEPGKIRNILEGLEALAESTGLAGRKAGDRFVDPATQDELIFQDLKFFPEEGGRFTPEQLDSALESITGQLGVPVQWENNRSPRSGGFAIATFGQGDKTIATGRYFESIKPQATDNYLPNIVLGRYKFAGKSAAKAQAGLTPQDLLTDQTGLTIPKIMTQLAAKLGTDNPLYHVAHHIAMGEDLPMTIRAPEGVSFSAFRDYFCEILQPMALQMGQYTGNGDEAAELFLGQEGFGGTLINFDASKNAGLSDSTLESPDGRIVKVSSKGGAGATASAKNLLNSVEELRGTAAGKKLLNKYQPEIDMVQEIVKSGQAGAPLYLGEKFNIITPEEAEIIQGLKGSRPANIQDEAQLQAMGLTPNLIEMAQNRGTETPEATNLYYHLIAAVAHKAVVHVNDKTNFAEAASSILNNGALIQVYTKASEKGGNWTLQGFDTKYPGESVSGVQLSASKTYYSTGIKGNFTFKILRGNAKAAPDDDTPEVPAPPVAKPKSMREPGISTRPTGRGLGAGRGLR